MLLDDWIEVQARYSGARLLAAISATHLSMERPGFGQRITPRAGSVLASPVVAHYDPEPDYFFHWFRDAAVVLDGLRLARAHGYVSTQDADRRCGEFLAFNRELGALDGAAFLRSWSAQQQVQPQFRQYLRNEAEIAALRGEAIVCDTRVNADGTPDVSRWSRPQLDGPALRALAVARYLRDVPTLAPPCASLARELVRADLALTFAHLGSPCFDIWEEERAEHYYTWLVQAEALAEGSRVLGAEPRYGAGIRRTLERLDGFWSAIDHYYRSRLTVATGVDKSLDIAVLLAVLHAARARGPHSVLDARVQATVGALEVLFEREYPLNAGLQEGHAPALGRYAGDRYYSGGAYYFATLAGAQFYFCLAEQLAAGEPLAQVPDNRQFRERLGDADAASALARGDAFLRTVRAYTPTDGQLSEQFDQKDGRQTSARHLSWSYAALLSAAAARARARTLCEIRKGC